VPSGRYLYLNSFII